MPPADRGSAGGYGRGAEPTREREGGYRRRERDDADEGRRGARGDQQEEPLSREAQEVERPESGPAEVSPWTIPGSVEALAYRPAPPRSIEQAVLEVKRVVDALQHALTDMEEVLELIEDAEQQKVADEREVTRLQELLAR